MSSTNLSFLSDYSRALAQLVDNVTTGLVSVRIAPHRTVSGVGLNDHLIATADHSLRREQKVRVQGADGSEAEAVILGRDPSVDLAILKAEGLSIQPIAKSDGALKAGMFSAVVGLTTDVGPSASFGVIGAYGGARQTWRGGLLDSFIRLDVNLYPSQSGAAVLDANGNLIGMASGGLLRHSAVAVPMATLERVAHEIVSQGRIRHGYLGVGVQPVKIPANLQSKISQQQESGLILVNVEPDSPAEKGGLQLGDILLALGERTVAEIDDLQTALRGNVVGTSVEALVLRGGEPHTVSVTIGERGQKA